MPQALKLDFTKEQFKKILIYFVIMTEQTGRV